MNNKPVKLEDFEKHLLVEFLETYQDQFEELVEKCGYGLAGATISRQLLKKIKG